MASRLATDWEDPGARAYLDEVRDVTGFDAHLLRGAHMLPPFARRAAERGAAIAPLGPDRVLVPIIRDGTLVGALEMNRFGARPGAWSWWRLGLALSTVLGVLSVMASRVADLLARPLEQLAGAADRFGGGDLGHRAPVAYSPGWMVIEVRAVAVSFNRMADRVEAMVRGQRELLGAISHELRSPLGRARIALEIARDRLAPGLAGSGIAGAGDDADAAAPAGQRSPGAALDDVERQLGVIDGILGDLLDMTRAGLADVRRESRPLVAWLRARVADEPTPPAIVLEATGEAEEATPAFDAALLGRAVHNLLVNARAHGHPAAQPVVVTVAVVPFPRLPDEADAGEASGDTDPARRDSAIRVLVRDHGPGFPDGFIERAFEPFVRGDAARTRPTAGAGYGLGLTIVRRIVEAHGGKVFARNAPAPSGAGDRGGPPPGAEVGFDLPVGSTAR
jgi:signal transduction histidine kinase